MDGRQGGYFRIAGLVIRSTYAEMSRRLPIVIKPTFPIDKVTFQTRSTSVADDIEVTAQ
jgi:hypothetical protein